MASLEPKPAGRPPRVSTIDAAEAERLQHRVAELEAELAVAKVRGLGRGAAARRPRLGKTVAPAPAAGDSAPASKLTRRGSTHQHPRRHREHAARRNAAATGKQLVDRGKRWSEVARLFERSTRTLQRWCRLTDTVPNRGRPVIHSPREDRNAFLHLLDEYGPGVGLPTLKDCFPDMLRAEQADLLRRYRRVWRERHRVPLRVLHWPEPGRVWAIDFTEAATLLDGRFQYLLAVRDLASGRSLLWQPIEHANAANAAAWLATLFTHHGAPLVLKSDNGSHFDNAAVQELLRMWNVAHLFSPPHWPRYNGAVEAGIGSLKSRTDACAARHGRPGLWTWDDVAAAWQEANTSQEAAANADPRPTSCGTSRFADRRNRAATGSRRACRVRRGFELEADPARQGRRRYSPQRGTARRPIRLRTRRVRVSHLHEEANTSTADSPPKSGHHSVAGTSHALARYVGRGARGKERFCLEFPVRGFHGVVLSFSACFALLASRVTLRPHAFQA
ncbi:MAG: transposase family protein [Gemmataceae bacterium]